MIGTEYLCCVGGCCPQHAQQFKEDQKWRDAAMAERRNAGNTKVTKRVFGVMI